MAVSLQELRPTHGKGVKKNPWPGIIFVLVFHAFAIYALVTGLASSTVQLLKENIKAAVVQEDVKLDQPPPPPPPDFKPPPVVAVAPEVQIDLAQAPPPTTTTAISNAPPPPPKVEAPVAVAPPPPPAPPTEPVATTSHAVTAEDYPAVSIRLVEQGIVKIKYTIQTDGSVSDCQVTQSSGHTRLDDAACTMVKKRWKFKPATQGGKAVAVSLAADVRFQLK